MKVLDWIPFIGIATFLLKVSHYKRSYVRVHGMYTGMYLALTFIWLLPS
jgi:hypothetical protein